MLEQQNVTEHILIAEIERITGNPDLKKKMSAAALAFSRPESARKLATIIVDTALEHEPR